MALAGACLIVSEELTHELRMTLEIARSWGVSPSRFLGSERTSSVAYVHDHRGALLYSVETAEPEWSDEDREMALRLYNYEQSLCSGCGHPMTETMAPENEYAYVAELAIRCHRCTVAHTAGEKYQDNPVPSALHIPIVLRERAKP
jgi:hypothetical protein